MKKNFLVPILLALLFGYLCANYIFKEYDNSTLSSNAIYFLQAGAYKNIESSFDDLSDITNKITVEEDNKYYTYIGITSDSNIANKIKSIYKENNIELYIKEKNLNNKDFILELEQYDILLKNSKTFDEVNSILKTVLATYEERILGIS